MLIVRTRSLILVILLEAASRVVCPTLKFQSSLHKYGN